MNVPLVFSGSDGPDGHSVTGHEFPSSNNKDSASPGTSREDPSTVVEEVQPAMAVKRMAMSSRRGVEIMGVPGLASGEVERRVVRLVKRVGAE
jgi:hypothetical protein